MRVAKISALDEGSSMSTVENSGAAADLQGDAHRPEEGESQKEKEKPVRGDRTLAHGASRGIEPKRKN